MKLSIIIVHWNTPGTLRKQLDILGQMPRAEIIVVDNNSQKKVDHHAYPHVQWISLPLNVGYAAACNRGALHAKGDWVLFLNPDTLIQPEDITSMCEIAEREKYDACSPNPATDAYKKPLPSVLSLIHEFTPLKHVWKFASKHHTLFGGGLLIKKDVLQKLGGWDERFFLWFEDSDLTKRLIDGGYTIGWADVPFDHKGGSSFKKLSDLTKRALFFSSMDIYARKHFGVVSRLVLNILTKRFAPANLPFASEKGISITIPNMRKEQLDWFLEKNSSALEQIEDVIIVTSALSPENIGDYRATFPRIRWILIDTNYGFAHTVNIGFRSSVCLWIGTINDDVILPVGEKQSWAHTLVHEADAYVEPDVSLKVGSLNPLIRKPIGTVESIGVSIEKKGKARPITSSDTSHMHPVPITNGACVLYNRIALREIGLFDEAFGSYLEDVDLSLRLTRGGYIHLVDPRIEITHYGQRTSYTLGRTKKWLDFKNWILVILKNWTLRDMIMYFPAITLERLRNISGIMKG